MTPHFLCKFRLEGVIMIQHLNPVHFQLFGAILPERRHGSPAPDYTDGWQTLRLTTADAPVYLAEADTLLTADSGITILSVSEDGKTFLDFYLDKPVKLNGGIRYCLTALRGTSSAAIRAQELPQSIGSYTRREGFSVSHLLHVQSLYTFFYHEKEQGFLFSGEAHPMLELTYVDQGSLHSVADGQDLLLEQGDMVLYGPEQWHMQYADIGVAPRYVTISFDIAGGDLSTLFNQKFQAPQKAVILLQQMLREQEQMDKYAGDMILNLLTQILLILLREKGTPSGHLKPTHSLHNENEIIQRAQQYISTHIREKLSVPTVAKNIDISPSYLTALFHKHLQIAPGEYIRRIKLQESKQMIREASMNFTEIASALQYSTVHHFSRQFKEKFGITPSEYAKSVR